MQANEDFPLVRRHAAASDSGLGGDPARADLQTQLREKDAEIEKLLGYRDALLIDLAASLDREDAFKQTLATHEAAMLKMEEAVTLARRTFDHYAFIHQNKTPPDVEKAENNARLSEQMVEALSIQPTTEFLEAWFKERIGEPVAEVNYRNGCSNTKWLVKMPDGITSLYAVKP